MLSPYLGGIKGDDNLIFDKSNDIFEVLLWTIFIFLVLLNGVYFFFGLDINTSIKNLFSGNTLEVDLDIDENSNQGRENKKVIDKVLGDVKLFTDKTLNNKELEEEKDDDKDDDKDDGKDEEKKNN